MFPSSLFFSRPSLLLLSLLGMGLTDLHAVPVAVNDTFSGTEDTVLQGLGGTQILNAAFSTNAQGLTYVDDPFGTVAAGNATGSWLGTAGFSGGGLFIEAGGNPSINGGLRQASGGWNYTFSLPAAGEVSVAGRYRLACRGGMETNEWGDFVLRMDGTRYGAGGTSPNRYIERLLGPNVVNQGNNLESDTGWKQFTQTISLASGSHTLTLGVYNNNTTTTSELVNFYLDEIVITAASGTGVLGNDTGAAPVTAQKLTDPARGSVVLNANGTFTYTPQANYNGTDSFTYRAVDASGNSPAATVTLNIAAVNDLPVAAGNTYAATEDTLLTVPVASGVLANDSDVDGDTLTVSVRATAANGTLTLNANGSFSYLPGANFNGTDTFTYRVSDGTGVSGDATVTLNVASIADAPVAAADSYRTLVNTPLVVSLTTPVGQPTTPDVLVAAGSPVPLGDPAEVDLPVWKFLDNGSDQGTAWRGLTFNDATWSSGKGELGYGDGPERTLTGFGPDSSNKYPTTYFRTAFNVADRSAITALGLDLMRDDAAVVYLNGTEIYRDQSANGLPDLLQDPAFNAYSNGTISGADEAALVNLTALMTANAAQYLRDGNNVLAVEVHQATGGSSDLSMDLRLTAQRAPYAGVLYNDMDPDGQVISAQLVTSPLHGTLTLNPNGTFTYTPQSGYVGADSFVYRATDGAVSSPNTTVTLAVFTSGNVPPAAEADTYSTAEDTPLTVNAPGVLSNDTDFENTALTAQLVTGPAHGALSLNADGSFTYTPVADYAGADSFLYRARDAGNVASANALVTLNVTPVNDAPVAVADAYGMDVSGVLTVSAAGGVLANDSDPEGSALTAQVVSAPASGVLSLNPDGSFTYTAPAGFSGVRTFTYRALDGSLASAATTVTITINNAPIGGADSGYTTAEDTPLNIPAPGVLANDSDPEGAALTAVLLTQPARGSVLLRADGSFVYTPSPNAFGADVFTYGASDGVRTSAPVTVSVQITAVNDAPVAASDTYTARPDTLLTVVAGSGVLANDSDAEASALTLMQLTSTTNGTLVLAADGSFTYQPAPGYTGPDSFTYRISDGILDSAVATVSINVAQPGGDVVINEIMYRPGGGYPEDTAREYIEIYNRGTSTINLTGWTISSGVSFSFPAGRSLAPGAYLVIAANVASFQSTYPGVTNVIGGWTGSLSNSGEQIQLTDADGTDLDNVSYASEGDWAQRVRETVFNGWTWSTLANGGNRSVELRNALLGNNNGQNWAVSTAVGGTPGVVNSTKSTNIEPVIRAVKHSPVIPVPADRVLISCQLEDETPGTGLSATLYWRDATTSTPGAFQAAPMSTDGRGTWFAPVQPQANLSIVEFYISATDGTFTRTWPAITPEGQTANCQYLVTSEAISTTNDMYFLVLTAAENAAYVTTTASDSSGNKIDREFNNTLIVDRGGESSIHYRSDMRIRGNSSRDHTINGQPATPLRIGIPADDDLDGSNKFNLNPRGAHLQHLGMRAFQAAGLRGPNTIPVELRRNGVEQSSTNSGTGNFGMWVRAEDVSGELVSNHWPLASGGGAYKKGRPDQYWRATQSAPNNPDVFLDGFGKQNNSDANDWSDLTGFFAIWQEACAPHFPGSGFNDVAGSGGSATSDTGLWAGTAFSAAQISAVETVADLDQWARWFAVMTIIQDNETNISNGQDDDYAAYIEPRMVNGVSRRLLNLVPHDLDTIFGLGDSTLAFNSRGLYDMTDDGSVFRPLLPLFGNNSTAGNAAFRAKYFAALRELLGTVFEVTDSAVDSQPFNAFVDYHVGNWAPSATRTAIKDFMRQRRAYLLGLIGSGASVPPAATALATLTASHGGLFINEVLAANVSAHSNSGVFSDVVELKNSSAADIDLSGMSLTDDPLLKTRYVFPAGTSIPAGGLLLVYADDHVALPGLHTGFGISSDGDALYLYSSPGAGQVLLDSIVFGLQVPDYSIARTGSGATVWALTASSIGAENTTAVALSAPADLRINEWLGNADYRAGDDFIELYNASAQPVAIGGMSLTDDFINFPQRNVFPVLSFMGAGTWVEFKAQGSGAAAGNARELNFSIDSTLGNIALLGANGTVVDRADTISQFRDVSTGRGPDGTGRFSANSPPTPGYANGSLPDGALEILNFLRITEVMYNPASSGDSEYIEFRNVSDLAGTPADLDLSGVAFDRGITWTFPAGTVLPAGGYFLLVSDAATFQAQFPAVQVGGVFSGRLDNGGERLRYTIAGVSIPVLDFSYSDGWYPSTDGGGDSLEIVDALASPAMWDRKSGWQAASPSPGSVPAFGIYAGQDQAAAAGVPVYLDGVLHPGTFAPGAVSLAWSQVSGPATAAFTTGNYMDANATFSAPGVYVLRLSGTAPGPVTAADTVTVVVSETYDSWAARVLSSRPAAQRLPEADPDGDGSRNLVEYALAGNPLDPSVSGQPAIALVNGVPTMTWQRNLLADTALVITPEIAGDLLLWESGPANITAILKGTGGTVENWAATGAGMDLRKFMRLRIALPAAQ